MVEAALTHTTVNRSETVTASGESAKEETGQGAARWQRTSRSQNRAMRIDGLRVPLVREPE